MYTVSGEIKTIFRWALDHRGPTHGVCGTAYIFIGNVCGLPKGSKYPEKSRNKRKFALPGVFCLLWASKRQIRAIWRVLRLPVTIE